MKTKLRISMLAVLAAAALALSACSEPVADFDGKKRTEAQIEARVADAVAAAAAQQKIEAADAAEKIRRAAQAAELAEAQARRSLEVASRKVEHAAIESRDVLSDEYATKVEAVKGSLADSIEAANLRMQASAMQRTSDLAAIKMQASDAIADIQRQYEQRSFVVNALSTVGNSSVVQAGVATLPGGGLIQSLLGMGLAGAGAWAVRSRGSRQRHDASWQEGFDAAAAAAKEKQAATDAAWTEAQNDAQHTALLAAALTK